MLLQLLRSENVLYANLPAAGTLVAQRSPHPNPSTCEHVAWHGRKDCAEAMNLRLLRWTGRLSWRGGWAQCDHRALTHGSGERRVRGLEDAVLPALEKVEGPKAKGGRQLRQPDKVRKHVPPQPPGAQSDDSETHFEL